MSVVRATDEANDRQKSVIVQKVKKHFKSVKGLRLALWGLAFKPRTDDVREAPAFEIIQALTEEGASLRAYDPAAIENTRKRFQNGIEYFKSSYEALNGCDALVIATEWNEFRSPDFEIIKKSLKTPVIFDGRNIFEPSHVRSLGFTYYCIGREKA
jgi:UDPglucose 6-dehydrogenase